MEKDYHHNINEQYVLDLIHVAKVVKYLVSVNDFCHCKSQKITFPDVPYMYHCHMLTHEDAGMMGQFLVIGDPTSTTGFENSNPSFLIFPNPTEDYLSISLLEENSLINNISIYNITGEIMIEKSGLEHSELNIDVSSFPSGSYFLKAKITSNQVVYKITIF